MSVNTYWYIGLSLVSLIIFGIVLLTKNKVRSSLLFLIMVQIAYLIETVIYIFLESYIYYPMILKGNQYFDSNMGALTSNMVILPALATLIAAYRLGWIWQLLVIALVAGVELLFVELKIYALNWWRIQYTSMGLIFFFALARILYSRILEPLRGWQHTLYLFLFTGPILGTLHILPIMIFHNRYYHPGWFEDVAHDTTAFSSIYYLCGAAIVVSFVKLSQKHPWLNYVALAAVFSIITISLHLLGILQSRVAWDPWYYILSPLAVYATSQAMNTRLSNGAPEETRSSH
jgi:hypothetical protein